MDWATFWAIFYQTHPVTLAADVACCATFELMRFKCTYILSCFDFLSAEVEMY
jgi:hypothetical protein